MPVQEKGVEVKVSTNETQSITCVNGATSGPGKLNSTRVNTNTPQCLCLLSTPIPIRRRSMSGRWGNTLPEPQEGRIGGVVQRCKGELRL